MQGEEEENQERNLSISVSDALSSIFSDSLNLQEGTENKKSFKVLLIIFYYLIGKHFITF